MFCIFQCFCYTLWLCECVIVSVCRFIESHWFVWVTQMSHIPMDIDHEKHQDWFSMQVKLTVGLHNSMRIHTYRHSLMNASFLSFSWWQPVTLSRPSSTTGSADTSTFRLSTSKCVEHFVRFIVSVKTCALKVN